VRHLHKVVGSTTGSTFTSKELILSLVYLLQHSLLVRDAVSTCLRVCLCVCVCVCVWIVCHTTVHTLAISRRRRRSRRLEWPWNRMVLKRFPKRDDMFPVGVPHRRRHHRVVSWDPCVTLEWPRPIAHLQKSAGERLLSERTWSSRFIFGRPGGRFQERSAHVHRVKWRHSNLWSRYDLHVVGHNGVNGEDLSRYLNKIESVALREA